MSPEKIKIVKSNLSELQGYKVADVKEILSIVELYVNLILNRYQIC